MTNPTVLPLPESTYQLLLDAARTWPGAVATQWIPDPSDHLRCLTWTYAELAGMVTRIANALTSLGVRRQDAVTLSGVNTSMLYAATLAAQAVGIAAPVNPALGGERVAELLRRTQSRVLVAAGPELDRQLWERLLTVARRVGWPPSSSCDRTVSTARRRCPPSAPDGDVPDDASADQPADRLVGVTARGADCGIRPHRRHHGLPGRRADPPASSPVLRRSPRAVNHPGESILSGLPLHVNALLVTGVAPMFGGQRVVWPSPAGYRDPALYARFWQIVEHYQIAAMSAVPTVYSALARVRVDTDISSLRIPIVGASPLPASVREAFAAHTGRRLLEGYGLTEATCASTYTPPGEERIGSVGRALPHQQVKAVRIDDDGSWVDCAPGHVGVYWCGVTVYARTSRTLSSTATVA